MFLHGLFSGRLLCRHPSCRRGGKLPLVPLAGCSGAMFSALLIRFEARGRMLLIHRPSPGVTLRTTHTLPACKFFPQASPCQEGHAPFPRSLCEQQMGMQGDAGQPGAGFLAAAGSRLPSRMCLVATGTSSPCAGRHSTLKMTPARGRDASGIRHAQTPPRQLVLREHGP